MSLNTAEIHAPSEVAVGVKRQQPSAHGSEDLLQQELLPPDYSKRRRLEQHGDHSMHSSVHNQHFAQLTRSPQSAFKVPNWRSSQPQGNVVRH